MTVKLKKRECVEAEHHKYVRRTIKKWQENGWRLHTYQMIGMAAGSTSYTASHYLLYEKGE